MDWIRITKSTGAMFSCPCNAWLKDENHSVMTLTVICYLSSEGDFYIRKISKKYVTSYKACIHLYGEFVRTLGEVDFILIPGNVKTKALLILLFQVASQKTTLITGATSSMRNRWKENDNHC